VLHGKLSADVVSDGLKAANEPMLACYQRELVRDAKQRGKVSMRFVIGRDGAVSNVSHGGGSTLRSSQAIGCMLQALYPLKSPPPEAGIVTVVVSAGLDP